MNKKQLLSIAMLISVVGINAHDLKKDPFSALTRCIAQQRAPYEASLKGSGVAPSAGVNARTFQDAADAKAAEIANKGAGNVDETGIFTNAWNGVKAFPGIAYSAVKTRGGDVYGFVKENPTTSAVRGGAVLSAGYVVSRQAGNVWNKIKENPKTVASLLAAGLLGYYKGDVALAAAKSAYSYVPATPESVTSLANTVYSYVPSMPATPDFVNTAISYVPATPDFAKTAANVVISNPYTSAAYVAGIAQGVVDYVGLAGSDEEETATEIGTDAHRDMLRLNTNELIQTAKFKDLFSEEKIVVVKELINWLNSEDGKQFQGFLYTDAANKLLAQLS